MRIHHVALWTSDLERSRRFYTDYFGCKAGPLYQSTRRPMRSYFLQFDSGAAIELMHMPGIGDRTQGDRIGWTHVAISVGSDADVDRLESRLRADGYRTTPPRRTGDGFYECTVEDPDGNLVEFTS